tara:strand:- start:3106 stop:3303 length:198 start_codon:yes stop_codon:yes gene_type:complete
LNNSKEHTITNTDLYINVYYNGSGWYLTKDIDGKRTPLSPLEAEYKKFPEIDTMKKLQSLAESLK